MFVGFLLWISMNFCFVNLLNDKLPLASLNPDILNQTSVPWVIMETFFP